MSLLILGVLLWSLPHLFKRLAPDARAKLGDKGKGLVALGIFAGIILMVIGYRSSETIFVWSPPLWTVHMNNLLMFIAVVLFGIGNSKSRWRAKMRHPMLTGVLVWAVAHLLVNGDLSSIVLFGSMGLWAIVEMQLINKQVHDYVPYAGGSAKGDLRLVLISIAVFVVIALIHMWIGPSPFPG